MKPLQNNGHACATGRLIRDFRNMDEELVMSAVLSHLSDFLQGRETNSVNARRQDNVVVIGAPELLRSFLGSRRNHSMVIVQDVCDCEACRAERARKSRRTDICKELVPCIPQGSSGSIPCLVRAYCMCELPASFLFVVHRLESIAKEYMLQGFYYYMLAYRFTATMTPNKYKKLYEREARSHDVCRHNCEVRKKQLQKATDSIAHYHENTLCPFTQESWLDALCRGGQQVLQLPCGHIFNKSHIEKYNEQQGKVTCPYRCEIVEDARNEYLKRIQDLRSQLSEEQEEREEENEEWRRQSRQFEERIEQLQQQQDEILSKAKHRQDALSKENSQLQKQVDALKEELQTLKDKQLKLQKLKDSFEEIRMILPQSAPDAMQTEGGKQSLLDLQRFNEHLKTDNQFLFSELRQLREEQRERDCENKSKQAQLEFDVQYLQRVIGDCKNAIVDGASFEDVKKMLACARICVCVD